MNINTENLTYQQFSAEYGETTALKAKEAGLFNNQKICHVSNEQMEAFLMSEGIGGAQISGQKPALVQPAISAADMTLLLMSVQSKLSEEQIKTGSESVKEMRDKMAEKHKARLEHINKYWDKMAESQSNSTGFFGRLIKCVKSLIKGDIAGAFENFGKAFSENWSTALAVAGIALFSIASGPMGILYGGLLLAPHLLGDAEVVKTVAEMIGMDEKTASDWAMGLNIASQVAYGIISAVVTIAISIVVSCVATPAAGALVGALVGALFATPALFGVPAQVDSGIKNYQGTMANKDALTASAKGDEIQAEYETLKEFLNRHMQDLQTIMNGISNRTNTVMEAIKTQASTMDMASRNI